MHRWRILAILLVSSTAFAQETHPTLALNSPAPSFSLPGVDGKVHQLSDYAASPILMIVFTCNHCPIAQMYEQRIQQLANEYGTKGVAIVAIQPNDPKAIQIDELDSSDTSDTLPEMKVRAAYKHLTYPYLYDGETQSVTRAYGPKATPHVFIFDEQRHLRYEGRFDNSYELEKVKSQDAKNALDALLTDKEVPVKHTGAFGCSTKWAEKADGSLAALQKIDDKPVGLESASIADLARLRTNPTHQLMLVDFWATWCGACISEFADLQNTLRMYQDRNLSLVTVSVNTPDERSAVLTFLRKQHASSRNLQFSSDETESLQRAFDPAWDSAVPYTVLLAGDGKVLYSALGSVDILELRRTILANLVPAYHGFSEYWRAK